LIVKREVKCGPPLPGVLVVGAEPRGFYRSDATKMTIRRWRSERLSLRLPPISSSRAEIYRRSRQTRACLSLLFLYSSRFFSLRPPSFQFSSRRRLISIVSYDVLSGGGNWAKSRVESPDERTVSDCIMTYRTVACSTSEPSIIRVSSDFSQSPHPRDHPSPDRRRPISEIAQRRKIADLLLPLAPHSSPWRLVVAN